MTTLFQRPATHWSAIGGLDTAREIAQQPDLWRQLADTLRTELPRIRAFLGGCLQDPRQHIILTGAGSSAYVGQLAAAEAAPRHAARISAIATTSMLTHPAHYLDPHVPTLLVSFARSGDSPESLAAVDLVRATVPGARFLNITCNPDGQLARRAIGSTDTATLMMPAASCDRGFAMTSSFTCMLLAALCALGADDACERLPLLADLGARALEDWPAQLAELAHTPFDRVIYLGSGPLEALARESALKLLELTGGAVLALAETPLGFRHGPKSVLNANTLVVQYRSTQALARRYEDDLMDELRRDGIAGRCVTVGPGADLPLATPDWNDVWLAPVWLVMAQLYALQRSAAMGRRPDNPFADGSVNRVVKGVTIYGAPHD